MTLRKRIQIGLIHVAVTLTLLPINSTLNRVMIKELAISAALVAGLVSLPYLFSPIQVAIGSISDRRPILGRRRTPYIVFGLLLCLGGAILAPSAAFGLADGGLSGLAFAVLAFGLWGMGYNFSTVSYFALASEGSDERSRGVTISVMFTMMIVSIIVMSLVISRVVADYSAQALQRAFWLTASVAAVLGALGLLGLEPRDERADSGEAGTRYGWRAIYGAVTGNRQARLFFLYLVLMLAAILGQDVLLEPFAGEAFGLTVEQTTRITSIWGGFFLLVMVVAGPLQRRASKRALANAASWGAVGAFALIIASAYMHSTPAFYGGVVLLGAATGLATVSNLSLMLDMTSAENVGLFMGAWGASSAFARLTGTVTGGVVRDVVAGVAGNAVLGYVVVFGLEALFLLVSLRILRRVDVRAFQERARQTTFVERAALVAEAGAD